MEDTFTLIISILLLITPIIDWTATFFLVRAYRRAKAANEGSIALSERAAMATVLAIASTANSILAVNRLFELHLNNFLALIVLSFSLLLVSVPNFYWLYLYFKNRLRE